jgi:hypothetical protein
MKSMTDLPYIVGGEWHDAEWCAVAAKGPSRSETEKALYAGGPRRHPWNPTLAYAEVHDGKYLIFPSKEAHDAFFAAPAAPAQPEVPPQETEAGDAPERKRSGK